MLPVFSPAIIQQELETIDRIVLAWLPIEHAPAFPNNHHTDARVLVRVQAVRVGAGGVAEIQAGEIWARPLAIDLAWDLCDGCKQRLSECCCAGIAADRAEEFGPWCEVCGSDGEYNYSECPLRLLYGPGECPSLTDAY